MFPPPPQAGEGRERNQPTDVGGFKGYLCAFVRSTAGKLPPTNVGGFRCNCRAEPYWCLSQSCWATVLRMKLPTLVGESRPAYNLAERPYEVLPEAADVSRSECSRLDTKAGERRDCHQPTDVGGFKRR